MGAVARTDEEEQVTIALLQSHIHDLQNEVRDLQDKTDRTNDDLQQQKESNVTNNQVLQKDIRDLKDKTQKELDESKAELKSDIADLKQQLLNLASNTTASSPTAAQPSNISPSARPSPLRAAPSFFFRRNDATHDALPPDTYTMMMTSPLRSQAWLLGVFTFAFQMVLIAIILSNQLKQSQSSSPFNVPFKVDTEVRVGQLFTIFFALATQNDITDAVRFIVMFWSDPHWDRTILGREEGAPPPTTYERLVHIILPNIIKFVQGCIVMFITFVVIVQSDNIIDLLKDFTALMVLSDTDNVFFRLAANGYIGSKLQMKAIRAQGIRIQTEASSSDSDSDSDSNRGINQTAASTSPSVSPIQQKNFIIRPTILFVIALMMIGNWLNIVSHQENGMYFERRYPKCNETSNAFELAKDHFGDGVCYGGTLNTLGCDFEGGDCINFNLAFPLCKGDNRTDAQTRVGDGHCEKEFMSSDCDYDGGDCCPYEIMDDPSFGDGTCDKKANFEECGYDNGDCVDYNRDYSGCPLDVVFGNALFGDGQWCNGGIASTKNCSYDDGDCDEFHISYPKCPLDDLSEVEGADDVVIGDGICDSGIYNLAECGYEFGDCNHGQVGQPITESVKFDDIHSTFSKALSLDGMTMALGLPLTNEDGIINYLYGAPGLVKIWRYNSIRKMWSQLGNDIVGQQQNDHIGISTSLSADGNRLMISSYSGIRIYDFNPASDDWIQMGQTITFSLPWDSIPIGVMASDGLKVAVLYSFDEIRVYDLDESSNYDVIEPGVYLSIGLPQLTFNTNDGSRLLLSADYITKIYEFNPDSTPKSWTQIGKDIKSPSSSYSSAISADGNRIAVSSNATSTNAPGQVDVYDYDAVDNAWIQVGDPIKSSSSSNGDNFGYDIKLSSDSNLLVIASHSPECRRFSNHFYVSNCKSGSIEVYNSRPHFNRFQKALPNTASPFKADGNVLNLANLVSNREIFGLHFSMDGDGSVLSISGYDVDDESVFVEAYDLNELFHTKCVVPVPDLIGNGWCDDYPPFINEECGFDGGDCDTKPVKGWPDCIIPAFQHNWIGDGWCDDYPPYNSKECGFDSGDCVPKPVEKYPDCILPASIHNQIGNGYCRDYPPYNSKECGFDGGDCVPKPVEGWPECVILPQYHNMIGDGDCIDGPLYNSEECGFDGGDCIPKPVEGYPECFVHDTDYIGDGICFDWPPHNSEECGIDGGDCERNPVDGWPECFVHYTGLIGSGDCNDWPPYNSEECGFDGGDCERNPVEGWPECFVHDTGRIGNGKCRDYPPYNTEECGFDGGDCR